MEMTIRGLSTVLDFVLVREESNDGDRSAYKIIHAVRREAGKIIPIDLDVVRSTWHVCPVLVVVQGYSCRVACIPWWAADCASVFYQRLTHCGDPRGHQ